MPSNRITRSSIIDTLASKNPHLFYRDVEKVVLAFFDEISKNLSQGNRIELRGFGVLGSKERKARVGRNPRTGESVQVSSKAIPFFKMGKQLKKKLNASNK